MSPREAIRERSFLTDNGVRLHYLTAGEGPVAAFIPGFMMPARIWNRQIATFSKSRRAAALSPRGQGDSDRPTAGITTEERMRDIPMWLDAMGAKQADFIGWSMGGNELLALIGHSGTTRVRSVTLVDVYLGGDHSPDAVRRRSDWLRRLRGDRERFTAELIRGCCLHDQPPGFLDGLIEEALTMPEAAALSLMEETLARDYRPWLERIDVPLLCMIAGGGAPADTATQKAAEIRRLAPRSRVEVFESCGHALFLDDPARFDRVLDGFLRDARGR